LRRTTKTAIATRAVPTSRTPADKGASDWTVVAADAANWESFAQIQ